MTWRWPWVSRARLDFAEQLRAQESRLRMDAAEVHHEQIRAERARYDDLLARYHMLKLQGAVVVEPEQPREIVKPDIVKAALAVACRGNWDLLKQQERAVQRDRDAGLSDDEIVRRIKAGTRVQAEYEVLEPTGHEHRIELTPTPSADASVA